MFDRTSKPPYRLANREFLFYCWVTAGNPRRSLRTNGGRSMERDARLFDYIFNPESVAIIGASPHDLATLAQMSTKITTS